MNQFNWVDLLVVGILLFHGIEGYTFGFVTATFDLAKFIVSFIFGLKFYGIVAKWLVATFSFSPGIANAVGFFVAAFLIEIFLQLVLGGIISLVEKTSFVQKFLRTRLNRILGIVPSLFSGAILLMFVTTLITTLPVSPSLKRAITSSQFGGFFVAKSASIESRLTKVFGGAATETINFLTVEPESNSTIPLHFTTTHGTVDEGAENTMLQLVNNERTSRGISALVMDAKLQEVARAHAQDMLVRGYFSHYTPEGLSPFDRMTQANIVYTDAGENLAFSPNVNLAMQGLMQSPGHKANILSKNFGRVGIGAIDAGLYGEMFVQEFTN